MGTERKDFKKTSTYRGHVEDDMMFLVTSRVQDNCFKNDPDDPMAVRYK